MEWKMEKVFNKMLLLLIIITVLQGKTFASINHILAAKNNNRNSEAGYNAGYFSGLGEFLEFDAKKNAFV